MKKSKAVLPPRPEATSVSQLDGTEQPPAAPDTADPKTVEIVRPQKKTDLFLRKGPRGARW